VLIFKAKGYLAMGGQIIDTTIVPAPRHRNSRDDNATVKAGETPAEWEAHPAKNRQKDKDARWTKKHGRAHFGYKNHIGIDRRHKLVRRYVVSSASVHDSQNGGRARSRQHCQRGVGRQRLSQRRDRGKARRARDD
jgi:IS5 family transposase